MLIITLTFCKSLLQVRGRHVYRHESKDNWIAMCPGPFHGRLGWCIGNDSTMETRGPVVFGKKCISKRQK